MKFNSNYFQASYYSLIGGYKSLLKTPASGQYALGKHDLFSG
jgi:hypothetical protein